MTNFSEKQLDKNIPRLDRVVFEYSDGTTKYIDEEELRKWIRMNKDIAIFADSHGIIIPFETIKWRKTGKQKFY